MNIENYIPLWAVNELKGLKDIDKIRLIESFDSPSEIFDCTVEELVARCEMDADKASELCAQFPKLLKEAEKHCEDCKKLEIDAVTCLEEEYPEKLLECPDYPLILHYKGTPVFNNKKFLSVVGTRNATEYGKKITASLVHDMAAAYPDICIVSGLAYGIDIVAHTAALESKVSTIAVMAGSLKRIYPGNHKETAAQITKNDGAVISEFNLSEEYFPQNFLKRNRIIAGIADGIAVIESGFKGGSLSTATLANSYNRDVFAFPGRVGDKMSEGCLNLIKNNKAALVTCANDLIYLLPWEDNVEKTARRKKKKKTEAPAKAIEEKEITGLSESEMELYKIIKENKNCHKDSLMLLYPKPEEVNMLLIGLEFKGAIKCLPGNFYETR